MRLIGLSSYINIGVQDKLTDFQNRLIQLTNIVTLAIMLASLAGIGLFFYGLYLYPKDISLFQGAIPLVQMIILFMVLHLTRIHEYYSARLLLVLSSIISILSIGLLFDSASGNNTFFILGPLGIFLLLGLTSYAYSLVFLSFMMMMGILLYQSYYPPIIIMPEMFMEVCYIVSIVVVFTLVLLMTYFLMQTNQVMQERLIYIMQTDTLTGLYNRLKYNSFIKDATKKAIKNNHPLSIIAIDIDHFKMYNDTYGHLEGDEALKKVANVLKEYGTDDILVTRFGGEEFAIILYNMEKQQAITMAEEILMKVKALRINHAKSLVADIVTLSLGVATVMPREKEISPDLFGIADKRLYSAKANGRNQVAY